MSEADNDLAVLNPPVVKGTIRGHEIVCREYGFVEELRLRVYSQPFIDDLNKLFQRGDGGLANADKLFATHIDAIERLISASANVEVEFIRSLSRKEGNQLLDMWWAANGDFFVGCATEYAKDNLLARVMKIKAAGETSMQPSLQADTTLTGSATTPIDN